MSAYAVPFQYCSFQEAGRRTPSLSSKKYTSADRIVCAAGQVSSAHCAPVLGQVPQRRLTVSLELGGSMPSLIAATLSHDEVYDADGVALVARLTGVGPPPPTWSWNDLVTGVLLLS